MPCSCCLPLLNLNVLDRLHPHGVLTISAWALFASEGTGFSKTFPGINLRVGVGP